MHIQRRMERGSALSDEVVGHAAHAEPVRGAAAVRAGACRAAGPRHLVRRYERCRAAGIKVSHGIAYGVCRLRPSLSSMIRSAVVTRRHVLWQMCRVAWCESSAAIALLHGPVCTRGVPYVLRAGWCLASRLSSAAIAPLHEPVCTRRMPYVLRPRRCLWLSAPPHTPVWGYRKHLPPAGDVIGAALVKVPIMKNKAVL